MHYTSVCLSVTRVDQSKTVEARIMKFSPYGSPIPLAFESRNSPEWGRQAVKQGLEGRGRETSHFLVLSLNAIISKTVEDMSKVTIND